MKIIKLTRGLETTVDDDTYEWASKYNWYADRKGYAIRIGKAHEGERKGESIFLHKEILGCTKEEQGDHKNHNIQDNLKSNLRKCTHAQNMQNRASYGKTSKFKGVHKSRNKWRSRIRIDEIRVSLGVYTTEEEAALIYDQAAMLFHGEFTVLNFKESQEYYKDKDKIDKILLSIYYEACKRIERAAQRKSERQKAALEKFIVLTTATGLTKS